jgi:tyrosinase
MSGATRRCVLQHVGGAAIAGVGCLAGTHRSTAQTASSPRVRSEASTAAGAANLVIYRAAVRYMRSLPSTDRRSWAYQVSIHNNWCPHRNWYLLPWHREYLLALENIIRGLSTAKVPNASKFAMPYWNWTNHGTLPPAFTASTSGGTPNPLYNSTRDLAASGSIPSEAVSTTVMQSIYLQTKFIGSGATKASDNQRKSAIAGILEATPHNIVHNTIGGDMATMLSPRDPIFFLHHANIDRIWASWNRQGGANPTQTAWRDRTFTNNFARPAGTLYSIAVRNISDVAYRYDSYDPAPASAQVATEFAPEADWIQVATAGPLTGMLSESVSKVRIANKNGASLGRPAAIPVSLQGCRRNGRREAAVRLLDLASPTIANAPVVRVFVNHPAISPTTLPEGPHYVGTFSFFGTAAQHQVLRTVEASSGQRFSAEDLYITDPDDATAQAATSVSVELPLTQALQRLDAARKPIGDTVTLQLVPVALGSTPEQVEIQPEAVEVEFF